MNTLTPLRGSARPSDNPPPANVEQTLQAQAQAQQALPGIVAEDKDDKDDDDDDDDDKKKKKDKSKAKESKEKESVAVAESADAYARGVSDERSRIRAIMECEAAKTRPATAMQLALLTGTPADQAVVLLGAVPVEASSRGDDLRSRMSQEQPHGDIGSDLPGPGGDAVQATAAAIIAAGKKRRGEAA